MILLAIDPGTRQSAYVYFDTLAEAITYHGIEQNAAIVTRLGGFGGVDFRVVIEDLQCFGMPIGQEVLTTAKWIGRFHQQADRHNRVEFVNRSDVKLHLCGTMRSKDSNVRQAILDRFGGKEAAIGKKSSPGPLYGLKSHEWQALAVALTYADDLTETRGRLTGKA